MTYDFTSVIDRRGLDALAIDHPPGLPREGFDLIPMWVADMNFATCPAVTEALERRMAHPLYGYFAPRAEYFDAIRRWQRLRNGVEGLEPRHIGYENGVLGGLASILRAVARPQDGILLHSPTYIGFTHTLRDNGYENVLLSPLRRDGEGVWRMDFQDLEDKLRRGGVRVAILCSPHNPTGRVWERWELEAYLDLARRYGLTVVSDEIWSDLLRPGVVHIPTQSVSPDAAQRTAALYAPSKTFNLAGLIGSYHIIYNDGLRARVEEVSRATHYNEMNVLSMHALLGAYSDAGMEWCDQLRAVLADNADLAWDFFAQRCPGVSAAKPQGTYMLFLDCTEWCRSRGVELDALLRSGWDVGVAWQDGRPFHGPCHIRMNLALPRPRLAEALARLEKYVFC